MNEQDKRPESDGDQDESLVSPEEKGEMDQEEFAEVIERMPPELRETMGVMMKISGPMPNPLMKKITTEHITKIIDSGDKESERDYQREKEERSYNLIIFIIVILTILLLTGFLVFMKEKDLLMNLIVALLGFAGGFGVGKYYNKK